MSNDYLYAAEKLSAARRALMLPHSEGEAYSIMMAFEECGHGLSQLDRESLRDEARQWVDTISDLMDTTGIDDPGQRGTWVIKGERMSIDEKLDLSSAVDQLASWLRDQLPDA
jgi:hypothetical protein